MPHTIEDLIKGYKNFRRDYYLQSNPLFEQLVSQGQQPKILVVACSDSRVDPAIILNTKPGDLFVVRNVANLIPNYEADDHFHGTSAALEFGVCGLKIKHIIILGHTLCGGIESLVNHSKAIESKQFITKWMKLAESAYEIVQEKYADRTIQEQSVICGQYALINSLKNLQTFPWIKEAIAHNELLTYGWYFNLASGIIEEYDKEKNAFVPLA